MTKISSIKATNVEQPRPHQQNKRPAYHWMSYVIVRFFL